MDPVATLPTTRLRTRRAALLRLPAIAEARGLLVWGESGTHLPFELKRFWSICSVPPDQARGGHAHRSLHEVLVCLRGSCCVTLDDGAERDEVVLDTPTLGLHLEPLVWSSQHRFTANAILLVLASEAYQPEDRIGDYAEFLALAGRRDEDTAKRAGRPLPELVEGSR